MACLDKEISRNRDDYNGGEQQSDFISSTLVSQAIKKDVQLTKVMCSWDFTDTLTRRRIMTIVDIKKVRKL